MCSEVTTTSSTTVQLSTSTTHDIDYCDGIDCGGPSICTNGIGKYTCECAEDEDWFGGGVNKICEKTLCTCTGNGGYWQASNTIDDGDIKIGYDWGPAYGESCAAHEEEFYADNPEELWMLEPWYANRLAVRPRMFYAMGEAMCSLFYTQ